MCFSSKNLYHYTSGQGLIGILDSDCIWASQCQYLNDQEEFSHAVRIAQRAVMEPGATGGPIFLIEIRRMLAEKIGRIQPIVFVASFSEESDLLSQWRSYCPSSMGYNIGFCLDSLITIAQKNDFIVGSCIYEDTVKETFCSNWCNHIINDIRRDPRITIDPRRVVEDAVDNYMSIFIEKCAFFKHSAFAEEAEIRMVSKMPPNTKIAKVRAGKSMLIPYIPIPLGTKTDGNPIKTIMVGPTPNQELASNAVSFLVQHINGFNHWTNSRIPYRDW